MSELDIEALKRIMETKPAKEVAGVLFIHAAAIVAALEDRKRLRAVVETIANEPETYDGRCPECVLGDYHEEWCSRGKCIAALEGRDG